jgi:glycosyltransferase involved in cell wall biosynthesis
VFCPPLEDFGGVQQVVLRVGAALVARGNPIALVARQPGGPPRPLPDRDAGTGAPIVRIRFVRAPHAGAGWRATRRFVRRFPPSAWRLVRAVRASRPDVVATHCSKFFAPYVLALRATGVPIVVHLHNGPVTADGPESPALFRLLVRAATRVVAVSPPVAEYARASVPARADRVVVVANGVDHDAFADVPPRPRARPFVLGVGRLAAQKGFDLLVDACAALPPSHDLVLAGEGPDRDALLRRAAARGIGDRVVLLGLVDRTTVAGLLRAAAVVAIPSRFEGHPLIALEAMTAGAPIVASALPNMPAELRHDVSGLCVPPGDVPALAAAILALVGDPERARRLGRGAADAARGIPGWDEVADRTLAAYRAALE